MASAGPLLALLPAGCSPARDDAELWPLADPPLPSLSCRAPIEPVGECGSPADCGEGQACVRDTEHESADREPVALRCAAPIGAGEARAPCDDGSACQSGLCSLGGVCLTPCVGDDDCTTGQACEPVEVRIPEGLAPVQACARVAAFPPDVELSLTHAATLRAGRVNPIDITTRGETSLFVFKVDFANTLRVVRLEDSSGRALFDLAAQLDGTAQLNPVGNEGALLPLLLPNNPRLPRGSTYEVGLTATRDTELTLIQVTRAKRGRVLDLNVFYVGGGSSLRAGGLRAGDREFRAVLERLGARYAAIGIELGEVREHDVEGALREELAELEVRSQVEDGTIVGQELVGLDRLLALSAGVDSGGVNLFVVRSMGPLLGVSGGTPGALGLIGTPSSGVALALDTAGIDRADHVLFHELGHELGLFHTTELDGGVTDPLSDTPVCGPQYDANADGVLRATECGGRGAENLMFWEGGGDALSAQQVDILRRALILR